MLKRLHIEGVREAWERVADNVYTQPRLVVSWYDGEAHRLRIAYYPATGEVKLYSHGRPFRGAWVFEEAYSWDRGLPPERIAHLARAALIAEAAKRFPDRGDTGTATSRGCRGKLRTVSRR